MVLTPRLLRLLDRKSERLLDRLSSVEPEIIHRAPVEKAWSPFQVMQHISLVERASVDYLLYKYGQEDALVPQSLQTRWRGKLVIAGLLSPLKFKAPKPVDVSGQSLLDAPTLSDIGAQMRAARTDLRNLIDTAPEAWLSGAVYRHPSVGRMSLDDMTLMMLVHHDRHERQIDRGLAKNTRDYRR